MLSPDRVKRHVVKCEWKCKYCRTVFGSENINHYGVDLPDLIKPTWFFASMTLLDHLRDCKGEDHSAALAARFGADFLTHATIYEWFNIHATIERHYISEEDLQQE